MIYYMGVGCRVVSGCRGCRDTRPTTWCGRVTLKNGSWIPSSYRCGSFALFYSWSTGTLCLSSPSSPTASRQECPTFLFTHCENPSSRGGWKIVPVEWKKKKNGCWSETHEWILTPFSRDPLIDLSQCNMYSDKVFVCLLLFDKKGLFIINRERESKDRTYIWL